MHVYTNDREKTKQTNKVRNILVYLNKNLFQIRKNN